LLIILPRRSLLPVLGCRIEARACGVRRLSYQLRDVLGKFGKDRASEVHPARICKGFERTGDVEIAFDSQQGRFAASRLDVRRFDGLVTGIRNRKSESILSSMGDGSAVSERGADLVRNRRFESISLQR